jgi:hypothetical protein
MNLRLSKLISLAILTLILTLTCLPQIKNQTTNGATSKKKSRYSITVDELLSTAERANLNRLPQTPVVERLTTDAQNLDIKGKIKSVISDYYVVRKGGVRTSITMSISYFDSVGNHVLRIV